MNRLEEALKLLPYSLQGDPVVTAMYEAAIIQLQELYEDALLIFDLVIISNLPEELLDLIAFEKHVDFYDKNLRVDVKREIVDNSIIQHMEKGTAGAVERALANIGVTGEVVEWYRYEGIPFTFKIILSSPVDLTNSDIKRIINTYKNTRSHFEHFEVQILQVIGIMRALTYTFPVPYKVTGTFHTAPTNGVASKSTVSAKPKTYANPVPYPITGTFYCSEGGH